MKHSLLCLLLLFLYLPLNAQGRGRPEEKDNLTLVTAYSGREDFNYRSAGFSSAFGLGALGGYKFSGSASAAHHRTLTAGTFPGEVYDTSLALKAGGKTWSFTGGAKSNSDRPFNSPAEIDLSLDAARTLSRKGPHAVMFGVSYSSRRSFLKGVPFPYLSYAYRSEKLTLLLPFAAKWKFSETSELSASYFPPKYFSVAVSRRFSPALTLAASGGLQLHQYLLADRPDKSQALFLEQPQAGLRTVLTPATGWEVSLLTAWGFKGAYFTGEQYDRRHGKVTVGAGPVTGLNLRRYF
jgi:hypothetical protein